MRRCSPHLRRNANWICASNGLLLSSRDGCGITGKHFGGSADGTAHARSDSGALGKLHFSDAREDTGVDRDACDPRNRGHSALAGRVARGRHSRRHSRVDDDRSGRGGDCIRSLPGAPARAVCLCGA
jgi:hypothetical protein